MSLTYKLLFNLVKVYASLQGIHLTYIDAQLLVLRGIKIKQLKQYSSLTQIASKDVITSYVKEGNWDNILAWTKELKKQSIELDLEWKDGILALDLLGKTPEEAVHKMEGTHSFEIHQIINHSLDVFYSIKNKYTDFSYILFAKPIKETLDTILINTLENYCLTNDKTDTKKTANWLKSEILSRDIWDKELKVEILEQECHIKAIVNT